MHIIRKPLKPIVVALALIVSACSSPVVDQFEGTWKVLDTGGQPFEITLGSDGIAKANRAGEGMRGTWKVQNSAAVIAWDTGWTTKISKSGDGYVKSAFEKGEAPEGKIANAWAAEKVE